MRRKVIALTALICLVAAGAAFAATSLNNYKAGFSFAGKAGSKKKPAPIGVTLTYTAANTNSADRAWPLVQINSSWTGVTENWKGFPTCAAKQMNNPNNGYDKACPAGSLVASGTVKSVLGPSSDMSKSSSSGAFPCNLVLHVYNSGHGKLTYYFEIAKFGNCGPLMTGAAAPYTGTLSESHGSLVEKLKLPPDVSTEAGGQAGLYGSLEYEKLTFKKLTKKIHGKKVPFLASTGCKRKKHDWSVTFTATNGQTKQSKTLKGKAKC